MKDRLPMKISQLKTIVKRGEAEDIEFKKSTALLSHVMQTVCAFLNSTTGGTVLIGVTDDKKIVGQAVSDGTKKEIANELAKIEPNANPKIEYVQLTDNRYVIALSIKPGALAPYVYDGRPYIRSQSTTRKMPQEKYELLLHNRRPLSAAWESLTANNCTISDLDKKRIRQIVNKAVAMGRLTDIASHEKVIEVLKKFNLMDGHKLTNAAVILFCKNEQKQFIQSMIKLARFRGIDKSEFIDNKAVHGNLFDLYETSIAFLNTYVPIAGKIEEYTRIDSPAIPVKVLREALINAFCHRDYSSRSGSIDIAVYDDRVEITNIGILPSDITIRELSQKHKSFPRNPLIAHVLYSCGMIERWGRGTIDMIELCKKSGNKPPRFEESTGSFSVTLPFKEPIARTVISHKPTVELTNRQREVLNILKNGPLTRLQIMKIMKEKLTARIMQLELAKMRDMKLIQSIGKTKSIMWELLD